MINLFKVSEDDEGRVRLQSQLYVGRLAADFILENGTLKKWGIGEAGIGFYESKMDYKIVERVEDMAIRFKSD